MSLAPGSRLGPYEVVERIGAGGMGEVYRARDPRLGRDVAIKVLPPGRAGDARALERFEREARAVAALSHPHILAVYEFGTEAGATYLVSELLTGESLRARVSRGPIPWRKAADIGAEVAQGLAAAHEKGVVHRDLKPENLFLTADGHVKILDFGLARLGPTHGDADTVTAGAGTDPGMVLGTAGYMSPEQVRGEEVDGRSDIFALGCVLHEMMTGQRAFRRGSSVETMAAILNEEPAEPPGSGSRMPTEIGTIVRHCLEKRAGDRFQSARDLAFALRAAAAGSGASAGASVEDRRSRRWLVVPAILLAVAAAAWWYFTRYGPADAPERSALSVVRMTNTGRASEPAISPDGRLVAYVTGDESTSSIRMYQVATGSDVELVPAGGSVYTAPGFSPDGAYVYYNATHPARFSGSIQRVPAVGGAPRLAFADAVSSPRFSPDGRSVAFARARMPEFSIEIVIAAADGTGERVLTSAKALALVGFNWSPDGRELVMVKEIGAPPRITLVALGAADGRERRLTEQEWRNVTGPVWLTGGRGLLVVAREQDEVPQIWHADPQTGRARRLTDSPTGYGTFSVAGNVDAFVADVWDREVSIWVGQPASPQSWRRVEADAGRRDGDGGVSWTHDGRLLYASRNQGSQSIWVMEADGRSRRQLTHEGDASSPEVSPDGRSVALARRQDGIPNIWRMAIDGSGLRQVTAVDRASSPTWTPDSEAILFVGNATGAGRPGVLRVPAAGGDPVLVSDQLFNRPSVSPDGKWLAAMARDSQDRFLAAVAPYPDARTWRPIAGVSASAAGVRWAPDGRIVFPKPETSGSNLWRVSIDGSAPERLTAFDGGEVVHWAWSRDGRLVCVRSRASQDVFLMTGLSGILPAPAR